MGISQGLKPSLENEKSLITWGVQEALKIAT